MRQITSRADGTFVLGVHVLGETDRAEFLASMVALEQRVLRAFTPIEAMPVSTATEGGAA